MMLGRMNAAAMGHANDDRASQASASAVSQPRHVIGDLIHGGVDESHELDFRYRAQSLGGHADGHSRNHAFRERGVLYAILTELLLESGRRTEYTAVDTDIFAQYHDARVTRHLPRVRAVDGFDHRNFGHGERET